MMKFNLPRLRKGVPMACALVLLTVLASSAAPVTAGASLLDSHRRIRSHPAREQRDGYASAGNLGAANPRSKPPDFTGRLQGLDVSHWNGTIHWDHVKQSGMRFVVAKATEGTGFTDPAYAAYRAGARSAHLHFTAYEFADPGPGRRDPNEDAAHFVRVAALKPADLVPVLDLEQTGGLKPDELVAWVETWCNAVEHRLGVRPVIYVSPSFWTEDMTDTTALAAAGDPLWIAHWYVQDPTLPAASWDGIGWILWQWTDRGSVGGIGGHVDLDVLNGTSFDSLTIANARAAVTTSVS